MRKATLGIAALSLAAGIAIGMGVSNPLSHSAKPAVHTSSSAEVATLPADCRSALHLGTEGFGVALAGLGQAQSAVSQASPAGSSAASATSAAFGVLGQSSARVQGLVQQYNQAVSTCSSASGLNK